MIGRLTLLYPFLFAMLPVLLIVNCSPGEASKPFGAFGAYYVPSGRATAFADSVTLVNLSRKPEGGTATGGSSAEAVAI
jgi:hypothetical protein